jgi:RHS repeat-associated protein
MTYDKLNRMLRHEGPSGVEVFSYRGAEWHRFSQATAAGGKQFLYDGDNVVADLSSGVDAFYVTPFLDQNLSITTGGSTYYYSQDGLGSVRTLTDSTGAVKNSYDYLPFGGAYQPGTSVTVEQSYTYTGREKNPESALMYYRYRQYDPRVGRFGGRDRGIYVYDGNLYVYVGSRVARFVDPLGLKDVTSENLDWDDFTTTTEGLGGGHARVFLEFDVDYGKEKVECEESSSAHCDECKAYGDYVYYYGWDDPDTERNERGWVKGRKPGPDSGMYAEGACFHCEWSHPQATAKMKFVSGRVKPGMQTDALLNHEAGHLRIQEHVAGALQRSLRVIVGQAYACTEDVAKWAAEMSYRSQATDSEAWYWGYAVTMHRNYDADTDHGRDAGEQSQWDEWANDPYGTGPDFPPEWR